MKPARAPYLFDVVIDPEMMSPLVMSAEDN